MSYFSQRGATGPLPFNGTVADQSLATLVGSIFETSDGREFVLVQNAGTALVAGNLIQGPAKVTNHQAVAVTTYTAAASGLPASAIVTLGNTVATANQYAGGYAIVATATGIGQTLKIAKNTAAAGSAACTLTFEDAPAVALDATSTLNLIPNPFGSLNGTDFRTLGVVVCPTTLTGQVLGVAITALAASTATVPQYGFVQTKGLCGCLNDATTAIGLDLMHSTNTPGAVMTYAVATSSRIGSSTQAGVTTQVGQITVQL